MSKFFNSMAGSWFKVFLGAILTEYLVMLGKGQQLFSWDKDMAQTLATAGVVAVLPVVINYINPADTRYGPTKQKQDEKQGID